MSTKKGKSPIKGMHRHVFEAAVDAEAERLYRNFRADLLAASGSGGLLDGEVVVGPETYAEHLLRRGSARRIVLARHRHSDAVRHRLPAEETRRRLRASMAELAGVLIERAEASARPQLP